MINPEYQRAGIAYNAIKELLSNPGEYLTKKPKEFKAFISGNNYPSINLFKKLGFNVALMDRQMNFYKATKQQLDLETEPTN